MQTQLIDQVITYDGTQLRPHWIYDQFGILGDSVVAFIGEANVSLDHMIDKEDVKRQAAIYSPSMVHFIGEFFIDSLDQAILLQHLFCSLIYEQLWEAGIAGLSRRGNDLYFSGRKLSVSIATRSPVSVLIHIGVNVKTEGTPVPTAGLFELKLEAPTFAKDALARFAADFALWRKSRFKVSGRDHHTHNG